MSEPNNPSDVDEFAGIEPAPPRRSPILALSIIGVCLASIFHLRAELVYALSSRSPAPIEELRAAGLPYLDRYVRVHGIPDRRNSLYVETRGAKSRESFFRLLDQDPPIFVRAVDTAHRSDLSDSWQGRLQRFADVPYASSLRDYFGRAAQTKRYLDLSVLKTGLSDGVLRDRTGREVRLAPSTELEVELAPREYALELPRERFPRQEDAQHELERVLASLKLPLRALEPSPDSFRFATPMLEHDPPRRNALFAALEAGEIDIAPEIPVRKAPLSGCKLEGEDLVVGADKLPWSTVTSVGWREMLRIEDGALVLTEGETPAGVLWAPLIAALLAALAAFNVWYLLRRRRA